MHFILITD